MKKVEIVETRYVIMELIKYLKERLIGKNAYEMFYVRKLLKIIGIMA